MFVRKNTCRPLTGFKISRDQYCPHTGGAICLPGVGRSKRQNIQRKLVFRRKAENSRISEISIAIDTGQSLCPDVCTE